MATILIVDDEKNIRTHLATYLRGLGHAVEAAADAAEALARARPASSPTSSSPTCAWPAWTAWRCCARSAARRPDAVVVLMTAYATVPQRGRGDARRAPTTTW